MNILEMSYLTGYNRLMDVILRKQMFLTTRTGPAITLKEYVIDCSNKENLHNGIQTNIPLSNR